MIVFCPSLIHFPLLEKLVRFSVIISVPLIVIMLPSLTSRAWLLTEMPEHLREVEASANSIN